VSDQQRSGGPAGQGAPLRGGPAPSAVARLKVRVAGALVARTALVLGIAAGGAALGALLADATVVLPLGARIATPWLLACGAAAIAVWGAARVRRLSDLRVARRFEGAYPELGTAMTNAVQLAAPPPGARGTPVETVLRARAVELGHKAASGVRTWPVERARVLALSAALLATALAWSGVWAGWGDVLRAVFPRFLDPRGDHPPYSRLSFEVEPGDSEVAYGGQLEVRVRASGRPVEKLWLVSRDLDDKDAGPAPSHNAGRDLRATMFVAPDGSYFQTLANLRRPMRYWVTDGRARSHRFSIGVRYTPRITMAECAVKFPEYMRRKPKKHKLLGHATPKEGSEAGARSTVEAGEFRIPLESRVTFRIASNRPLAGGALVLTPVLGGKRREVELAAETACLRADTHRQEGGSVVSGEIEFTGAAAFSLSVTDVSGLASTRRVCGRFMVEPDERPRIWVVEPGKNAVATPEVKIPVRVRAEDDHSVERIVWFRSHNGSVERPHDMALKPGVRGAPRKACLRADTHRQAEAESALDMADLGVRPGDAIEYFFEAVDNSPRGPNLATSRVFRIEIISVEEYKRLLKMMAARRALFEAQSRLGDWLRRLSERGDDLRKLAEAGDPGKAMKEARRLAKDLAEYRKELAGVLKQPDLFDVDPFLKDALRKQQRELKRLAEELDRAMEAGDAGAVADAAGRLAALSRYERQAVAEPVRHVRSVVDVLARASAFARLTAEQRRIVRMAERFKEARKDLTRLERMELQDLAHAEGRVRDGIRKIVDDLPGLIELVPDDAEYDDLRRTATDFVAAVAEAGIVADLGAASDLFAEPDGPTARAMAAKALEKMEKLVAKAPSGQGSTPGFRSVFQPSLADAMSSSVGQILSAMGMGSGSGGGGSGGYGMFAGDVALYGPAAMLGGSGELGGSGGAGRGEGLGGRGAGLRRDATDAADPALSGPNTRAGARLETEPRFPLRYRQLVGEYFRVVAESLSEED